MKQLLTVLASLLIFSGCASAPENKSARYDNLRGKRYVIYVANEKNQHIEAAIQIENRIKAVLADKGLLVVDFDPTSLSNFLKNDGSVGEGQAKRVASNADLIVTGRFTEEQMKDENINKTGTFRTRIRTSFAITETVSAIERGRIEEEQQEMANSFESAGQHAAIAIGKRVGALIVDKLLYIYQ